MSVRAYKILEYRETDTFNIWGLNSEIFEFLNRGDCFRSNYCGEIGYCDIRQEDLDEMKEKLKDKVPEEELNEFITAVENDFEEEDKKQGLGYAHYICF